MIEIENPGHDIDCDFDFDFEPTFHLKRNARLMITAMNYYDYEYYEYDCDNGLRNGRMFWR